MLQDDATFVTTLTRLGWEVNAEQRVKWNYTVEDVSGPWRIESKRAREAEW